MIKIIALSLVNIALVRTNCSVQHSVMRNNYLCWDRSKKLTWNDFQARKAPVPGYATGAFAAPEIKVKSVFDSIDVAKNNFVVRVVFNRSNSWVQDSCASTSALLAHEQLHFDIAELFGRRLRFRIAQTRALKIDISDAKFSKAIQLLLDEHESIHDSYDAETWHGRDDSQQTKWQTYIRAELAKLERYASTEADCNGF